MSKLIFNGQEIADCTYTSGGGGGNYTDTAYDESTMLIADKYIAQNGVETAYNGTYARA